MPRIEKPLEIQNIIIYTVGQPKRISSNSSIPNTSDIILKKGPTTFRMNIETAFWKGTV